MSHMTTMKAKFSKQHMNALKLALVGLGYKNSCISTSETLMQMNDYYGKSHTKKCHVKLSGVGAGRSDIGIEFDNAGNAIIHTDNMNRIDTNKLTQLYVKEVVKEVASDNGYGLESEEITKDGELVITVTSQW